MRRVVDRLPRALQDALYAGVPRRWRGGRRFWRAYDALKRTQSWDGDQLQAYQLGRLNDIIDLCAKHVPFYRKRWAEHGVSPLKVDNVSDLRRFPYTTKQDLIEHAEAMVPDTVDRERQLKTRTGGTSGTPAEFLYSREAAQTDLAFTALSWEWHGCDMFSSPMAFFRGSYEFTNTVTRVRNHYYLPTWELSATRLTEFAHLLREERVQFLHGYPSLIYELLREAEEQNVALPELKAVFMASERTYAYQRTFIEEHFGVRVSCQYGQQELVARFLQCPHSSGYHVMQEYGYTEFEPVAGSELFEIVATGFLNEATPLIRYRTGDYATLLDGTGCVCGCPAPVRVGEIVGRSGDCIVTPGGLIVQPNHLEYAIRFIRHFSDCQVIQDGADHLTVLIVPDDDYDPKEGDAFAEALQGRILDPMKIEVKLVDTIPRTEAHKKRFTINTYSGGSAR